MKGTRRAVIAGVGSTSAIGLAGCINQNLVDTTYDCDVTEPDAISENTRPTIGDEDRDITVHIAIDYTRGPTRGLIRNTVDQLIEDYVSEGVINIKFYDAIVEESHVWAYDIASSARYIYAEGGEEAYLTLLRELTEDNDIEFSWQLIGDVANETGVEPCKAISHGSWTTFEEESRKDREEFLTVGEGESPAVIVNNERITEMTPVGDVYPHISDEIESQLERMQIELNSN